MATSPLLPARRRGVRAAAGVTFAAAMAACALVAVVFSGADRGDALLQRMVFAGPAGGDALDLIAATGGGYALPPGYEATGKDIEARDHSRWWEHGSAPSQQRKPAAPAAPAAGETRAVKTDRLPKEMLDAMVSSSVVLTYCINSTRAKGGVRASTLDYCVV